MLHIVQVDQSGKVEDTKEDTVLALSNGITYTILIPAIVKRECLTTLRRIGYSGQTLYNLLFSTTLFLLLKDQIQNLSYIHIDDEYLGQSAVIKEHLLHLLRKYSLQIESDRVQINHIGEHNPADEIARQTLRKKLKPDKKVAAESILREFKQKKDRGSPHGEKT
jgi:hypothetical protein